TLGLQPHALAYHPEGTRLAVASYAGREIQVRDTSTGELLRKWTAPAGVFDVAWHPNGVLLAAGCFDNCAYLWDAMSGQQHRILQGHQSTVVKLAFAPTGDTVVSHSWDGTGRFWDVSTGRELMRLAGTVSPFSRDGRRLISVAGTKCTLLEVTPGLECRSLPQSRFSPGEKISH